MLRFCAFMFAATVFETAAALATPVATFDCTPTDVKLRGLHMLYAIDQRGGTVHEFMRDVSGAPAPTDPRKSSFRDQTLPVEYDGTLVMWSIQSPAGPVHRILDRTSNILTVSARMQISRQLRIVQTHIPCEKQKPVPPFGN